MSLGEFKRVVREQFFMLLVDERVPWRRSPPCSRKIRPLPRACERCCGGLIETVGLRSDEAKTRLAELEDLIEQSADPDRTSTPSGQQFAKLRPLPIHAGRSQSMVEQRGSQLETRVSTPCLTFCDPKI